MTKKKTGSQDKLRGSLPGRATGTAGARPLHPLHPEHLNPEGKEKHRRQMMTMIGHFCNKSLMSLQRLQLLHQLTLVIFFFLLL